MDAAWNVVEFDGEALRFLAPDRRWTPERESALPFGSLAEALRFAETGAEGTRVGPNVPETRAVDPHAVPSETPEQPLTRAQR